MAARRVGRFRILAPLGKGGMASVWRAEDELTGRTVALKVLAEDLAASPSARRRFRHEAEIATPLEHPGIVPVFAHGEDDGVTWIAMGLVEGEPLSARLARSLPPVDEALRIAAEAADALAYAHARHVIHRDVSANNVMIGKDGGVFVLDFGLARAEGVSRLTSSGSTMGTLHFLAPEVLGGSEADERSDVYGLGVVLYELLTGSAPFAGERVEVLAARVTNEDPEPPSARRAGLLPCVDALVLRAIAREPARRFPDAGAFAAALGAVRAQLHALPPAAPAPRDAEALVRSLEKDRALYLAVAPVESPEGPLAALARGIEEALRARLAEPSRVRVVAERAPADPAGWREFALAAGATAVIGGRLRESGARLRIELWLVEPGSGARLAGGHADGAAFDPFVLEDAAVEEARRMLKLPEDLAHAVTRPLRHDPAAPEKLARAKRYLQRFDHEASVDGAIRLLEELTASADATAEWWAMFSQACLARYRLTHERSWEARAAEACRHAMEMAPDAPATRVAHGRLLALAGRDAAARAEFERAIELDPQDADAWFGLAALHDQLGDSERAVSACDRVIALRPAEWRGHNLRGRALYRAGRFAEAVVSWREAARLSPENTLVASNLGSGLAQLNRLDEAERELRRAIDLLPEARAYNNLGTVLFTMGRHAEAVAAFEKATSLNATHAMWWGDLGNACRFVPGLEARAGAALDRAIALMRDELARDPEEPERWARLADWLQARGHSGEAEAALERALSMAPGNAHCLVLAAYVAQQRGDRARAVEMVRRALEAGHGVELIRRSVELQSLQELPEFRELLERHAAN